MKNQDFRTQYDVAQYILKVKSKEWLERSKKHVPQYIAEYLFYPKTSILADMLKIDPETGFKYDPLTLQNGIELLLKMTETKNNFSTNQSRIQAMYAGFADAQTRLDYLRLFAERLELYPFIGKQVIDDLNEVAKTSTDSEFMELLAGRIRVAERAINTPENERY